MLLIFHLVCDNSNCCLDENWEEWSHIWQIPTPLKVLLKHRKFCCCIDLLETQFPSWNNTVFISNLHNKFRRKTLCWSTCELRSICSYSKGKAELHITWMEFTSIKSDKIIWLLSFLVFIWRWFAFIPIEAILLLKCICSIK